MHSCRIKTGLEQLAGDAALVTADPSRRLAVSSWALITCRCRSRENELPLQPREQDDNGETKQRKNKTKSTPGRPSSQSIFVFLASYLEQKR